MDYKVVLSDFARQQLDNILFYIFCTLENEQAAKSVLKDAKSTIQKLSHVAGSLKVCDEPELRKYEYRKIHFAAHAYIILYRIEGAEVHIDRIYHELEDYTNLRE